MNKKRVAVIFAAILSCYAISATTASYYSARTGGNDVGIAKWDVSVDFMDGTEDMNFDGTNYQAGDAETKQYPFAISSTSEVPVRYSIKVAFNKAPPTYMRLWVDDGAKTACDGEKEEFVFGSFYYEIGGASKSHTFNVEVNYTDMDVDYETFNDVSVTVSVCAEQAL